MLIQERIQVILKMHHLTPSAFADKIGVQRSSISHVLSGRNKPGLDFLEKILLHFPRVNAHWLITGKVSDSKITETEKDFSTQLPETIDNQRGLQIESSATEIEKVLIFYKNGTFKTYSPSAE
jgi:transcriptional regulator with XRE-family HTH domain